MIYLIQIILSITINIIVESVILEISACLWLKMALFFVDSDDKIDPKNLSVFLQNTDFAFDLCSFSNFIITSDGKISKKIMDSNGVVWGKLFNFEIIKKNNMLICKSK